MMVVPYQTGHAFNKSFNSVDFTLEEEFRVTEYLVRIRKFSNQRFDFLFDTLPFYADVNVGFITYTMNGQKIPFNRELEKTLFARGSEFTKRNTKQIFQELNSLSSSVRGEMLSSTYPALYVVLFSILEGNTKEKTWLEQHSKTLQITEEVHARLKDRIAPLVNVRSISIKDQERFTSPWAMNWLDEQKFERSVSMLGRLLREDQGLQGLYFMLVMMTPSHRCSDKTKNDPVLQNIIRDLQILLYRYLEYQMKIKPRPHKCQELDVSLMNLTEDDPNQTANSIVSMLIDLVDEVHDCAEIMQYR